MQGRFAVAAEGGVYGLAFALIGFGPPLADRGFASGVEDERRRFRHCKLVCDIAGALNDAVAHGCGLVLPLGGIGGITRGSLQFCRNVVHTVGELHIGPSRSLAAAGGHQLQKHAKIVWQAQSG